MCNGNKSLPDLIDWLHNDGKLLIPVEIAVLLVAD